LVVNSPAEANAVSILNKIIYSFYNNPTKEKTMIIECNDVTEVVRVLRWMGGVENDNSFKIVLKKSKNDRSNSNDSCVPASQFMAAVSSESGRIEEW
jgi:hypothetical protein